MIGTEVSSFEYMPDIVGTEVLKPGKYAVFTHLGSLFNLEKTYNYILGTWILSTKEELDNREEMEISNLLGKIPTDMPIREALFVLINVLPIMQSKTATYL